MTAEPLGSLLSFLPLNPTTDLPPLHVPSPRKLLPAKLHSHSPPHQILSNRLRAQRVHTHHPSPSLPLPIHSSPPRNDISETEKIKLKNRHQLMRTMVKLEDQDEEIRKSSALNQSFFRMSNGLKEIRTTVDAKIPKIAPVKQMNVSDFALHPQEAQIMVGEVERGHWLRRRGVETEGTGLKGLLGFLKSLFSTLDEEGVGSLDCSQFTSSLVSLGVVPTSDWALKSLQTLQINHFKVYKNEFISSLKRDTRNWSISRILLKESDQNHSFTATNQTTNCVKTVERWWKEVDPHSIHWAAVHKVTDLLVGKEIVGNKYEGKSWIEGIKPLEGEMSIHREVFERLFAPAVMLAGLHKLNEALKSGEFSGNTIPLKVKLATYRRKLLLSGIVSHKSPNSIINALSSVHKLDSDSPLPIENSLNLTRLDFDPALGGQLSSHKRYLSVDNREKAALNIHGKVYFPSLREVPRPRDYQVTRENYILEKMTRAVDLREEQLGTYY